MKTAAKTVTAYLASLPVDRRAALSAVRDVVRANLDAAYEEGIQYGMIGYYVPHSVFPAGYHADPKQPLPFVALASQKNHMAIYLMGGDKDWFRAAWAKTGKKLDMGGSCVRFKTLENVALDVVGEMIRRSPAKAHVARYLELRGAAADGKEGRRKAAPKKAAQPAKKVAHSAPKKTAASAKVRPNAKKTTAVKRTKKSS
jgi:hypothetical protein